jgi:8-oxo-dGTP diphosphatase
MTIVKTRTGDELVEFRPATSPMMLEEYPDLPIMFACVVARHQGRVLFVFNNWRQEWELPSGLIDPGESPHDAATPQSLGFITRPTNNSVPVCVSRMAKMNG